MAARMRIAKWTLLIAGIAAAITYAAAGQAPRGKTEQEEPIAAKSPGKTPAKPPLKPGQIDLEKSRVYVYVGKKGLGHAHGVEGKLKSGSIKLGDDVNPGEIVIDMTSFSVDTDAARKQVELDGTIKDTTRELVTETMKGSDVLDVEKFPTATFKIKSCEQTKTKKHGHTLELKGDLTLHGKTRPLTLQAQIELKEGRRHVRGDFTILQSDFGITPYKAALGTVGVADELKIWGDIWVASESDQK